MNLIKQNLTDGMNDAIAVGPLSIQSFKLRESANYITTGFPRSGAAFVLLMNTGVYYGLSEEERGWGDAAADDALSLSGGAFYDKAAAGGLALGAEEGAEMIDISYAEKARRLEAIGPALDTATAEHAGAITIGEKTIVAGAAVPFGARHGAQVSVNLLDQVAERRVLRWSDAVMRLATAAIAGLATWGLYIKA